MENNIPICWKENGKYNPKNHFLLPDKSCRCIIIGESGCGKTNLIMRMLLLNKWLDYNNLYVFSKSLHQPEYKLMKSAFDNGYNKDEILNMFKKEQGDIDKFLEDLSMIRKNKIRVHYFEDAELIPDPKDVNANKKNIFIFDDVMTELKQNKCENYFTRGRHNNISSFYISQNFYKLPRQTIRGNSNCLILFELPQKDLQHIYHDYVSKDMAWEEFKHFCYTAWNEAFGYIVIVKDKKIVDGKYIANFNRIYLPNKRQ